MPQPWCMHIGPAKYVHTDSSQQIRVTGLHFHTITHAVNSASLMQCSCSGKVEKPLVRVGCSRERLHFPELSLNVVDEYGGVSSVSVLSVPRLGVETEDLGVFVVLEEIKEDRSMG